VLVLGALWPGQWDTLTRPDESHSQARMVLAGTDIPVPAAFAGLAMDDLLRAAASDPRLATVSNQQPRSRKVEVNRR
jgi:hypothetical protein